MQEKAFERMLESNPLRARVRELMEVRPLRAGAEVGDIPHALHVACGNGSATELIRKYFSVRRMSGTDRDPAVIAEARRKHPDVAADFSVQDVTSLSFDDAQFDAVFDLADLHNVPNWKRGLGEIGRVLRPGGLLFLEEISRETFARGAGRLFKALTVHPYDSMLTIGGLRSCAAEVGFEILHFEERNPLGLFRYYLMVARKAGPGPQAAQPERIDR
jgi:ubiquinone/menaquinone biosynthesis C-methylase UbiE